MQIALVKYVFGRNRTGKCASEDIRLVDRSGGLEQGPLRYLAPDEGECYF